MHIYRVGSPLLYALLPYAFECPYINARDVTILFLGSSSHLERAKISSGIEVVPREIQNNAYAKLIIVMIIILIKNNI